MYGTKDYLSLGSSPFGEDCVQVGTQDYLPKALAECKRYKEQLERKFPNLPSGCFFKTKSFPHDFGNYHEVVIVYDSSDESISDFACDVENNLPEFWEDEEVKVTKIVTKSQTVIPTADWVGGEEQAIEDSVFDNPIYVTCPFCSLDRQMESDASGIITCDCGKKYKVYPLI